MGPVASVASAVKQGVSPALTLDFLPGPSPKPPYLPAPYSWNTSSSVLFSLEHSVHHLPQEGSLSLVSPFSAHTTMANIFTVSAGLVVHTSPSSRIRDLWKGGIAFV